jgi:aldose 1-epimerase
MYLSHFIESLERWRMSLWRGIVMRSGLVIAIAVSLVLIAIGVALRERGQGRLALLRSQIKERTTPRPTTGPPPPPPGGQDVVVLQRTPVNGGTLPEFLSATLLPGRGMSVLQITAYLPDKGEVNLLASPTLEVASLRFAAGDAAAGRAAGLEVGGAIEAPWAGRLGGVKTTDGANVMAMWRGRGLIVPGDRADEARTLSDGGLLLTRRSDSVDSKVMPDGGNAQAVFSAGNFDGHWMSHTEVTTTTLLSSRAFEIKVVAKNTGSEPEPVGIGWRPRFSVVSGDREQATLRMPKSSREELDRRTGMPTGKVLPVTGTEYDFTARGGVPLGHKSLDESFVDLKPELLDNGPIIELRDLANDYGLRMTVLSTAVKAIRVNAPADKPFVTIDPQFNLDDPLGREWPKDQDTGLVVLEPGQSAQWRVRLELFPLTAGSSHP